MFRYFHEYFPQAWQGYEKNGFVDELTAIRLPHSWASKDYVDFNTLAVKDGAFYNLVKDLNCPLYIDRLLGGAYFYDYPYCQKTINDYIQLLGDDFYGFQLHEYCGAVRADFRKLQGPHSEECDWTPESIRKFLLKYYNYDDVVYTVSMSPEELSRCGPVKNVDEFYQVLLALFKRRNSQYRLMVCDSYQLGYKLWIENGVKTIAPEVGAQTPDSRIQISYARSMAKAYGIRFGVYYESWGGKPVSCGLYNRDHMSEWGQILSYGPFQTAGGNGGSSRALHKRILHYSYVSGAQFIADEWGLGNMFYDWQNFELTPYGYVRKHFLDFVKKYPNVGEKMAPVALVLPKDLKFLTNIHSGKFMDFEQEPEENQIPDSTKKIICDVFSNPADDMQGDEIKNLINSDIPDAVDMIHEDSPNIGDYQYLIDATAHPEFSAKHHNLCTVDDLPAVLKKTLPCYVEGGLHWLVNQSHDQYYLSIFNHSGVSRSVEDGEKILPGSEKTVKVTIKDGRSLKILEGSATVRQVGSDYFVTVSGGDWFFGQF